MNDLLTIFVPHCSGLLTDALPHGDGLVAHGFISRLAQRGHTLYVAAERIELSKPLPPNVKLFPMEMQPDALAWSRMRYMIQVRKLFRQLSKTVAFDLIHQLNPVYTGVSLALWGSKVPVVLGPYVADWPANPDAVYAPSKLARRLLGQSKTFAAHLQQRSATKILLTTEAAGKRVISKKIRSSRVQILPHGIDPEFFRPAEQTRVVASGTRPTVILFFANISERKGIFDLLDAFEMLADRFPDIELRIAGSGDRLDAARKRVSEMKASDRVRFLGRCSRQESAQLFPEADIYCLPSHGEPFGMTVLEAMSCALPVVVTDAGGVGSLVDNQGGIKVPMKDPRALANALAALVENPSRRNAMGVHNRNKVLTTYSWEKVIDQLEEVYRTTARAGRSSVARMEMTTAAVQPMSNRGEPI